MNQEKAKKEIIITIWENMLMIYPALLMSAIGYSIAIFSNIFNNFNSQLICIMVFFFSGAVLSYINYGVYHDYIQKDNKEVNKNKGNTTTISNIIHDFDENQL